MIPPARRGRIAGLLAGALLLGLASPGGHASAQEAEPTVLRVMTFNIRSGGIPDGDHAWERRRDVALRAIARRTPTVLGLQEANRGQLAAILDHLSGYRIVPGGPWGRDWRFSPIIYDAEVLRIVDAGEFWLSDTPDTPGSATWGNEFPRHAVWAVAELRATGRRLLLLNTHLSHAHGESRRRGARLIARRAADLPDHPIVLSGDLNTRPGGRPLRTLVEELDLIDAWEVAAEQAGPERTAHGFDGDPHARLDYVLCSPVFEVGRVEVCEDAEDGVYASDHFPVVAELTWPRADEASPSGG